MEARAEQRLARDVFDRTQRLSDEAVSSVAREIEVAAELDKAKARTELALVELERTEVRAPFDGVLGVRLVAVGDRVENEEPLVEIYAIDRLQAIFSVQEQGVPLAQVGLPVQVRVAAYGSEQFPGRVFFVAPALDAASRRLIMKAWIDNSDGRLKPGMFVNVDVEVARKEAALMVPESAVVYDRNGIFVWRDRPEGGAQKVPVELGLRQEGRVEVLEGLAPGDVVVATGINKVRAGSRLADPRRAPDEPIHAQDQAARAEGGAS